LGLDRKRIERAIAAWIATFAVIFVAWYVADYTDYPEVAFLLVLLGIIPIGAYACWQTVPSQSKQTSAADES
jgi:hypothetical protein